MYARKMRRSLRSAAHVWIWKAINIDGHEMSYGFTVWDVMTENSTSIHSSYKHFNNNQCVQISAGS